MEMIIFISLWLMMLTVEFLKMFKIEEWNSQHLKDFDVQSLLKMNSYKIANYSARLLSMKGFTLFMLQMLKKLSYFQCSALYSNT
jgi:hypothetical protein